MSMLQTLRVNETPDMTDIAIGAVANHSDPAWHALLRAVRSLTHTARACVSHLLHMTNQGASPSEDYVAWRLDMEARAHAATKATAELASAKLERARMAGHHLDKATIKGIYDRTLGWAISNSDRMAGLGTALHEGRAAWDHAEELAVTTLRNLGFSDAARTPPGADAGLDAIGMMVAAQVKYMVSKVGRPVLQQLVGASGDRACVCFSRGGYTAEALIFADERDIALFAIELPDEVRPVNRVADRLANN